MNDKPSRPALVSLVGAGPGHPGLITVRGVECLREADLVLYDKLAAPALLEYVRPDAQRLCVVELGNHHVQRHLPIHDTMIEASQRGLRVVRLKGGDPCIFGRGGEEAEALQKANVPFEIVPGITAAQGASAFAGIPLTHRACSSAVAFLTGHEDPEKPDSALDWPNLANFPGTLVIYMGMARLEHLMQTLIRAGKNPATPAAVVRWASTGEQHTVTAVMSELAATVRAAGVTPPALVIIGDVVELRSHLTWFEQLPLFNRRVLVTRPKAQSGDMVARLIRLGAVPFLLPTVEIHEPADWSPVDRAIAQLHTFQWLVFTSVNGVSAFFQRLRKLGHDLRALGSVRLAAIGPKTAAALQQYHLDADLVPTRFQSEDLAQALKAAIQSGDRVLLARADRGRELLRDELAGHCDVDQIAVYSQIDAIESSPAILDQLRRGEIEYITLTSSNIARALVAQLDDTCLHRLRTGETKLVSISAVTSAEVLKLGLSVAAEAAEATVDGVIAALIGLAREASHH